MASTAYKGVSLVGGGGHAVVVADTARAAGIEVVGFFDDDPDAQASGVADRLGPLEACRQLDHYGPAGAHTILALGKMDLRERLSHELLAAFATVVHPTAAVSESATVAAGVYVGAQAVVQTYAHVSEHVIVNTGAIVEHDCRIGRNVHIAPGAVLAGGVRVGEHTLIGLGARVLPNVEIGANARIGAGAVVVCDVPDGVTVKGVPAV